jgi:hypothetical protein
MAAALATAVAVVLDVPEYSHALRGAIAAIVVVVGLGTYVWFAIRIRGPGR